MARLRARPRTVLGVREAALSAAMSILRTSVFDPASTGDDFTGRGAPTAKATAAHLRQYWAARGNLPLDERMMDTLSDPRATAEAWREAAGNLARFGERRTIGTTVWSGRESPRGDPGFSAPLRGRLLTTIMPDGSVARTPLWSSPFSGIPLKVAALLIVLLTNEGHWMSGAPTEVTLRWNVGQAATPADLSWELTLDKAKLAGGTVAVDPAKDTTIRLTCPNVRARTAMVWRWRLRAKAGGNELASGAEAVMAYPADLTAGWAKFATGRRVVVVGRADGLSKLLTCAKVPHDRVDDVNALQITSAEVVLVDADALGDSPFEQGPLAGLAGNGAAIVVFRQTRPARVEGAALVSRAPPREFAWRADHPLIAGFDADCRASLEATWRRASPDGLLAARPDGDASATADLIVQWPSETAGEPPQSGTRAAADALLVSRAYGREPHVGRVVLCQMPLGDWQSDPRSQVFVGRVLDYLLASSHTAGAQP